MMSGETVTYTSNGPMPSFTLTSGNPEAARLRDVLVTLRPPDGVHDHLCDSEPGDPDRWIDESGDPPITGLRAVEWVKGIGLVTTDKPVALKPYVGWCCGSARARQEIDAALKVEAK